jgi:hypothetical protein
MREGFEMKKLIVAAGAILGITGLMLAVVATTAGGGAPALAVDPCPPTVTHARHVDAWYGTLSGDSVNASALELTDHISLGVEFTILVDSNIDSRVKDNLAPWVNAQADIEWVLGPPENLDAETALRAALQTAAPAGGVVTFAGPADRGAATYTLANWTTYCDHEVDHTGNAEVAYHELNATYSTGSPTPTTTPTPAPTGQPTPSATATPTPAPSGTPSPGATATWGDNDCSSTADAVDALKALRHVAALPVSQPPDCPEIGATVHVAEASDHQWGDVDCDGSIDAVDALKVLRHVAALPVTPVAQCPAIGSEVVVVEA